MNVMHFDSQKARLDYIKGNYEEIVPVIAVDEPEIEPKEEPKNAKNAEIVQKTAEIEQKTEKKRKKSAKKSKKDEKDGEVQAE